MPLLQELLRRKRDGLALDDADIRALVAGIADGRLCDAQVGAFAMAVCLRGMDKDETLALTLAMRDSGVRLDWRDAGLHGPVLDKHSTGGVGDCTSLLLGPLVAACGGHVPMLSGRGLGHTGGTLDKLQAIPGYDVAPSSERLRRVVREAGVAIVGASADLAPADRRLYAIRDVTATVESTPLIVASILSKKLAASPDALVLDVKAGSGATLPDLAQARALAERLVAVAGAAGLPASALLTDMSQPLASAVGNALELRLALRHLRGEQAEPRLLAVTLALGVEMLLQGRLASDRADAEARLRLALSSGRAAERFARMVALLGGPRDLLEREDGHLAAAPCIAPVFPTCEGVVAAIDTRALGLAVVALGGGRQRTDADIDPRVGLERVAAIGARVGRDAPLAWVHAGDPGALTQAAQRLRAAFRLADCAEAPAPIHAHLATAETATRPATA